MNMDNRLSCSPRKAARDDVAGKPRDGLGAAAGGVFFRDVFDEVAADDPGLGGDGAFCWAALQVRFASPLLLGGAAAFGVITGREYGPSGVVEF